MFLHVHTRNTYFNSGDIILKLSNIDGFKIGVIERNKKTIFKVGIKYIDQYYFESYDTLEDAKKRLAEILILCGESPTKALTMAEAYSHTSQDDCEYEKEATLAKKDGECSDDDKLKSLLALKGLQAIMN